VSGKLPTVKPKKLIRVLEQRLARLSRDELRKLL